MKNNWLITITVAIIVAAVAFYAGIQYQKNYSFANRYGRQNGTSFAGGRQRFGGATEGTVLNQDANSIIIQLRDGSSKIINITGSTTFLKTDTATKSGIQKGGQIAAFGTTNSDGSITAQSIQINPRFQNGKQ